MKSGIKTFAQVKPEIINRGRGPEIKGTRITVYDVWDYAKYGDHHSFIAIELGISSDQVLAALEYIEAHKADVMADYQKILDRCARGNSPEVRKKYVKTHRKFLAMLRRLKKNREREYNRDRDTVRS